MTHRNVSCSFCGKEQREVRKLIAGPTVHICDECIRLCTEIIAEESAAELEYARKRAEAELERARTELKRALSERTVLERVTWLAQHPDVNRVAIIARHFAEACNEASDVPRPVAERARSLAEELEALVRR